MIKNRGCSVVILVIRALYNVSSALVVIISAVALSAAVSRPQTTIPSLILLLFLELIPHLIALHTNFYPRKISTSPKLIAEYKTLTSALTYSMCIIKIVLGIYTVIEIQERMLLIKILYKWLVPHSAIGFVIHVLYNYIDLEKLSQPIYDDETNKLMRLSIVAFCISACTIASGLLILVVIEHVKHA